MYRLVFLLLVLWSETLAFAPRSLPWARLFPSPVAPRRPLSSTQANGDNGLAVDTHQKILSSVSSSSSSSPSSSVAGSAEQAAAQAALEKLRDRQRSELEATERLIELVTSKQSKGDVTPESLSTAASLLSGADYGFVSRSEGPPATLHGGLTAYYGPPSNVWSLGWQQFFRNWKAMQGEYADEPDCEAMSPRQVELQGKLKQLTLNSTEIWEREFADGPIEAPWIIKLPYFAICYMLDVVFEGRYVPSRFFLLETVARMPYFSYISMLHWYETLGFWRRSADAKRIHFAEELNEYGHLLIMESLGGDQSWWVRFIAQHSAIFYYAVLNILFAVSPSLSYQFSELLETHAVNTYSVFLKENEKLLKELPPSNAAVNYYSLGTSDPFYAEFQTASANLATNQEIRRPGEQMQSLFDVFTAICADEGDHVSTMAACSDPAANLRSPSLERRILTGVAVFAVSSYLLTTTGILDAGILDSASDAALATADTTLAELAAAGMAGFVERIMNDEESRAVGADLLEGGDGAAAVLEQLQRLAAQFGEFIARIL